METLVTTRVAMADKTEVDTQKQIPSLDEERTKPVSRGPRSRAPTATGRRSQSGKKRGAADKKRAPGGKRWDKKDKRRGKEENQGVTVKRTWSGGKRRWDKKHYCVFCQRPQVKITRHLLTKHADQQEVVAASTLPIGSKQRHLLLEQLRCRGNYLHNIEVIRQGSGEIVPYRQPSEDVDARSYLPCPLCLGFFRRADLWKHQASCRKKLVSDPSKDPTSTTETTSDHMKNSICDSTLKANCDTSEVRNSTEENLSDPSGNTIVVNQTGASEIGATPPMPSEASGDLNVMSDPRVERPRKRIRVQAAASRLLPISSGASESCGEVLHRMNQDHVSHQVKSDWLICKYGNKLMENQDSNQRRYDYVSQKLRELGRFLLAAKSLDSDIHTLQDVLASGRLSLALAAARKASGYRWSCPPLAVKTTLKTVCEIAIGESLQDGDWEAAAKTTDFYHMLERDWDNLGLLNPDPGTVAPEGGTKLKKRSVQSRNEKSAKGEDQVQPNPRPEVLSKSNKRPLISMIQLETRLQAPIPNPISIPMAPKKVQRRPWSIAEKEAVWRQLGVNVLLQSVPGKKVCQRCLDLEPVLRGRHWKDIKNQIHNQIQSQKKQQFHAQMDLQVNLEQQDQIQNLKQQQQHLQSQQQRYQSPIDQLTKDHIQNQNKKHCQPQMDQHDPESLQVQRKQQYHIQMDHEKQDSIQNQKKHQYHTQLDHHDHLQIHKKQLCHARLDHQDHVQVRKKQLYQMDQPPQGMCTTINRDTSILTASPYGPDGSHQAQAHSLGGRDPIISPYPLPHRTPAPQMDQLVSRTEWNDESLNQNYPISRHLARNLLQEAPPGGPLPNPHSGHVHF